MTWDDVRGWIALVTVLILVATSLAGYFKYRNEKREKEQAQLEAERQASITRFENALGVGMIFDPTVNILYVHNGSSRVIQDVCLRESGRITRRVSVLRPGDRVGFLVDFVYTRPNDPLANKKIKWKDLDGVGWDRTLDRLYG